MNMADANPIANDARYAARSSVFSPTPFVTHAARVGGGDMNPHIARDDLRRRRQQQCAVKEHRSISVAFGGADSSASQFNGPREAKFRHTVR